METDNFQLSEEQAMILETVRKFAQDKLEPTALDNDEHAVFVRASFDELAELGMLGIPLSEDSGGADMGWLSLVVAIEELGRVCGSTARLLLSQTALCGLALEGSDVAEEVAGGEKLAAFVGPEVGISATVAGDGFVLNLFGGMPQPDAPMLDTRTREPALIADHQLRENGRDVLGGYGIG